MSEAWTTAITEIRPNRVAVRGYDIASLMGRISFGEAVHLILRGELPTPAVGRLMDAILVSSIDHGATPPSALASRTVASTGAALGASVGAGITSINRHHGGAIEGCAKHLLTIVERAKGGDVAAAVAAHLADLRAQGERMPGFGHRVHTNDPRTSRLFDLARDAGLNGPFIACARAVEAAFAGAGKPLPINVDGALAAILLELGFDPPVMNGVFMIARAPGLVAHVVEEQSRMKPMRRIDPTDHSYDGPPARDVPPTR